MSAPTSYFSTAIRPPDINGCRVIGFVLTGEYRDQAEGVVLCDGVNDVTPWVTWRVYTDGERVVAHTGHYHMDEAEARADFRERAGL